MLGYDNNIQNLQENIWYRKDNIMFYRNLENEIIRAGLTKPEIAEVIGVSIKTFYNKLNGTSKFNEDEMKIIQYVINNRINQKLTLDYLFAKFDVIYKEV
jgi:DNA-binding XRE family transcriptional regulator